MKKIFIALLAAVAAFSASAQDDYLSLNASFNLSRPSSKGSDFKFGPGVSIGADYTFFVYNSVFVMPGINFNFSTWKIKDADDYLPDPSKYEKFSSNFRALSIGIPVVAGYQFGFSEKCSLKLYTGLQANIGLTNKFHYSYQLAGDKFNEDIDMYGSNGLWKRFDLAWKTGVGVHIDKFYVGLNTQIGFLNLNAKKGGATIHQNTIQITLGYSFF